MERPGKRVQEIPEDPEKQLKLALQGKLDEIEINNVLYTFRLEDHLRWIKVDNELVAMFHIKKRVLYAPMAMYPYKKIRQEIGIEGNYSHSGYRIDELEGIVILRFPNIEARINFSLLFPIFSTFDDYNIYIFNRELVFRLKNIVKMRYEPFFALLKNFEPSFKNVQFTVNNELRPSFPNGETIEGIHFKQFPSLNKLAWKKLTPEKQREFNIFAPNECRICQKPTEVMCSLTRIPFCSKECQMKYF